MMPCERGVDYYKYVADALPEESAFGSRDVDCTECLSDSMSVGHSQSSSASAAWCQECEDDFLPRTVEGDSRSASMLLHQATWLEDDHEEEPTTPSSGAKSRTPAKLVSATGAQCLEQEHHREQAYFGRSWAKRTFQLTAKLSVASTSVAKRREQAGWGTSPTATDGVTKQLLSL
eukprot:TRINITY_DN67565_c0_g1_i1.p1 TRINITY_DN67565_c0_g1~~TRINITY_DN67565_c0_g1_i1.p1  ORF type:complete len:175 (-),score=31.05 TRINITY_DN67565_c0_g1_i1:378-902(-)